MSGDWSVEVMATDGRNGRAFDGKWCLLRKNLPTRDDAVGVAADWRAEFPGRYRLRIRNLKNYFIPRQPKVDS